MARPTYEQSLSESGKIEIVKNKNAYNIFFKPIEEALPRGYYGKKDYKQLIALINLKKTLLRFFPFKGRGLYAMEPKYAHLLVITVEIENFNQNELDVDDIEDIFTRLPDVFIENYNYGLGFLKKYHQIASFIETLGAKHLYILKHKPTSYNRESKIIIINEKDLHTLKKSIDRISARAGRILLSAKHDIVA